MIRYLTELSVEAFTEAARNVPYQQINSDLFPGIDLWIRRDDLIDPIISGNKAYKLLFNLLEAREQGKDTIVTCGGAWSNHIHATAAAGQRFGFKTIGIIRGERPPVLSAMLQDAERFGMELRFVSRQEYRTRHEPDFSARIGLAARTTWFVPEGGANQQGAMGIRLLGKTIAETSPVPFSECWVACGTGLTLGALASSLPGSIKSVGVAVLKTKCSILAAVEEFADAQQNSAGHSWELITESDHGGYAKSTTALEKLKYQLETLSGIGLDHVYTGKVAYGLTQRAHESEAKRTMSRQKHILLIHSGGLQGSRGVG